MKLIIGGILIGIAAGLVGALCGVGGGIFMVPLFVGVLGLTQKQALATSLAIIIFTSLAATISNVRATQAGGPPLIQWPLFWTAAIGSSVAAYLMSDVMRRMSDITLTRIFASVLVGVGLWMWWRTTTGPAR
jgi:uncharacterized protein